MVSGRISPEIARFHPDRDAPYNRPLQIGRQRVESAADRPFEATPRPASPTRCTTKYPNFTAKELWVIRQAVPERFRKQANQAAQSAANPATN